MRATQFISVDFLCKNCGRCLTLPRPRSKRRTLFHHKHLYCLTCKQETIHIEAPEYRSEDHYLLY
ncbi:MAG: hypothetical protein Q4B80_01885 [Aerococcaceae bacterium]|nr:hypothetical protein [Aerococcaceae bacterium]